jgi:PTS system mannitol-specific IIA component
MKARDAEVTTYMGNGVAIPHGMNEYKKEILESGIVIAQYPDGVDFGDGNTAYIVIGIAGKGDEHMEILSKIALTVQFEENVERLRNAKSPEEIIQIIDEGEM